MTSLSIKGSVFNEIYEEVDGIYRFKAFVAGKWTLAEDFIDVRSPIDLSVIAKVSKLTWGDADRALDVIHNSGRWSIRDIPGWKRLEILNGIADSMEENKDDLANALVVNSGKTWKQALGEVDASIDRIRKAAFDSRKIYGEYMPGDWDKTTVETEAIVRREPFGTVLAIIPFNYPLFDVVSKFTYSVVVGNAVVIKPPSADPIPILLFAKLVEESNLPKESFAVLTIPGGEMDRLVADSRVQVISLTGSSKTGRKVIASSGIKQFIMELGGGDPAIVLSDADLNLAAERIAAGIYNYAGQRCDAIKLVLVYEGIYDKFKETLKQELSKVIVGDPRDQKTTMGPLIEASAVDDMLAAVEEAVQRGGKVVYGGKRIGQTYVEPTLVEFKDKNSMKVLKLYGEEIFAPVALITSFNDVNEAVGLANDRRFGLDAAIFGYNINEVRKLLRFLEFGTIYVNDMPRHGIGYYPFGGRKDSGIGREGVGYSIEYVTAYKTIVYSFKERRIWRYLVE